MSFLFDTFASEQFNEQTQVGDIGDLEKDFSTFETDSNEVVRGLDMAQAMESLREVLESFGTELLSEKEIELIKCSGRFSVAGLPLSYRATIPAGESYTGVAGAESVGEKISNFFGSIREKVAVKLGQAGAIMRKSSVVLKNSIARAEKLKTSLEAHQENSFSIDIDGEFPADVSGANWKNVFEEQLKNARVAAPIGVECSEAVAKFGSSSEIDELAKTIHGHLVTFQNQIKRGTEHEHPLLNSQVCTLTLTNDGGIAFFEKLSLKRSNEDSTMRLRNLEFKISKAEALKIVGDFIQVAQQTLRAIESMANIADSYKGKVGGLMQHMLRGASAGTKVGAVAGAATGAYGHLNKMKDTGYQERYIKKDYYDNFDGLDKEKLLKDAGNNTLKAGLIGSGAGAVAGAAAGAGLYAYRALFSNFYKTVTKVESVNLNLVRFMLDCVSINELEEVFGHL